MDIFEPDLLRTFLAFAEGGSLARAAAAVNRSPSAVTAQMQRLEAIIGEPLLSPDGRGRSLTPAGEDLVGHARRILAVHREAWLSVKGARADGRISLGATQDFADNTLPDLLRTFAATYPRVRFDLRVGRSHELTAAFDQGALDVLISMRMASTTNEIFVLREPTVWVCTPKASALTEPELPLALLDPPCGFRTAAIAALDAAGRPYRIAATSPSISGVRVAVRSGLAITARTERFLEPGIVVAPARLKLPKLPDAEFGLRLRADAGRPASDFAALLADELATRFTRR